jgi:RNA 3'-terminal phosphate cyclase (ATP)
VRITGGTHNKGAPPFDFLQRAFLPLIARMGAQAQIELVSYGFYHRGGGEIRVAITPAARLSPIEIHQRGERLRSYAEAYVAALPIHVAHRELEWIGRRLNWQPEQLFLRGLSNDVGPGNALTITLEHEHVTEVFSGFGERGVSAENVAENTTREVRDYLAAQAPVGIHLADQLLLPMALAGSGSFTTVGVTPHLKSNAIVIEKFAAKRVTTEKADDGYHVVVR